MIVVPNSNFVTLDKAHYVQWVWCVIEWEDGHIFGWENEPKYVVVVKPSTSLKTTSLQLKAPSQQP